MNTSVMDVKSALEEHLEYSNVTDLRQDFLPAIERIQKNPALRLLILKHGRPQAILMSSQTYDLFKRLVNAILTTTDKMSREQRIDAAFNRLTNERSPSLESAVAATASASATQKRPAKAIIGDIQNNLQELDNALQDEGVAGKVAG